MKYEIASPFDKLRARNDRKEKSHYQEPPSVIARSETTKSRSTGSSISLYHQSNNEKSEQSQRKEYQC